MARAEAIDVNFDFRSDTPPGKYSDPDVDSPTLRRYHKLLWSKPLPNGVAFELDDITPYVYLHHKSELGEFWLSSDAVVASDAVIPWSRKEAILEQIPHAERERWFRLVYTIGAMLSTLDSWRWRFRWNTATSQVHCPALTRPSDAI